MVARTWRAWCLIGVLTMTGMPTAAGATGQDDAGTGVDAPQAWTNAIALAIGSHAGELGITDGDTRDWYRVEIPAGQMLKISVEEMDGLVVFTEVRSDSGGILNQGYFDLQVSAVPAVRIGLLQDSGMGGYDLHLEVLAPLEQNDAGSGMDVSSQREGAWPTDPGVLTGTLHGNEGDRHDWYAIEVPPGKAIKAEITDPPPGEPGGTPLVLGLWTEAGQLLESEDYESYCCSSERWVIGQGITEARLVVTHPSVKIDYTLEIELFDPTPQNDAGTGTDVSTTPADALPIPLGVHDGQLHGDEGDRYDWYRVDVPEGHGLRANVGDRYRQVEIWSPDARCLYDAGDQYPAYATGLSSALISVGYRWSHHSGPTTQYSLVVSLFEAAPQDDAGTGGDAPNTWSCAMDAEPGAADAVLFRAQGDAWDWYRVDVPPGHMLQIEHPGLQMFVRDDAGMFLPLRTWGSEPDVYVVGSEAARIGVFTYGWSELPYVLDTEVVAAPNLVLADVTVGPEQLPGQPRLVTLKVENHGDGAARHARVDVRIEHPVLGRDRDLPSVELDPIEPGETRFVDVEWDTTGELGRVTVHATVVTIGDVDLRDNVAMVSEDIHVSQAGMDLLNNRYGDMAGMNYDADGTFAFVRYQDEPLCVHSEGGVGPDGEPYLVVDYTRPYTRSFYVFLSCSGMPPVPP